MNRPIASAKDLSILCPNLMLRTKKKPKKPERQAEETPEQKPSNQKTPAKSKTVVVHQIFPHTDLIQKSSSRLFPLPYFFILL